MHTAMYLLNRAPTRSLDGKTPYEAWHNRKPKVNHLRTFGCVAHVKRNGPGVTKLSDRSTPMVFVGYEAGTKGYHVYDPVTKKLQVSRDVVFEEHHGWNWGENIQKKATDSGVEVEFYSIAGRGTVTDNEQAEPALFPGHSSPVNNSPGHLPFNGDPAASPEPATPPSTPSAPHF